MGEHLAFVGPGRAGLALGYALWQTDRVESLTYFGRRPEPPSHPLFIQGKARYVFGLERPDPGTSAVFLSVPDDALREMAHTLAGQGDAPPGCAAFHLSGALSSDLLAPLHGRGYAVGTFHPLQSLAHPVTGADRLPGSAFAVSGERQAVRIAHRLLGHLRGQPLRIPVSGRPLYHAAAVTSSNYLAALMGVAARLLVRAGASHDEALGALLPLARGTLDNIEQLGLEGSLTGPVARGDADTLRLHLRSMEPREGEVYAALGRELVRLARGWELLDEDEAAELGRMFEREGGS